MTKRLTNSEFILRCKEIHKDKYDYSKTYYKSMRDKVIITCSIHGDFFQNSSIHLRGSGCSDCGRKVIGKSRMLPKELFIEKAIEIHGDRYDYSNIDYSELGKQCTFICNIHGPFVQLAYVHLRGSGCQYCNRRKNVNEQIIKKFLTDSKIEFSKIRLKLKINGKLSYLYPDFYIPKLNLFIEYNGSQHYEPVYFGSKTQIDDTNKQAIDNLRKQQIRDNVLREYCKTKCNLLEIDGREYTYEKLRNFLVGYFSENAGTSLTLKPWGSEEILGVTKKITMKKLLMKAGEKCSIQFHEYKSEIIYIVSGVMKLHHGYDSNNLQVDILKSGDSFTVPTGMIHCMEGFGEDCIYIEASTSELFDVQRISDLYGRVVK